VGFGAGCLASVEFIVRAVNDAAGQLLLFRWLEWCIGAYSLGVVQVVLILADSFFGWYALYLELAPCNNLVSVVGFPDLFCTFYFLIF